MTHLAEFKGNSTSEVQSVGDRVYVVDDHAELRRSIHFLLATKGIAVWPFENASDFLDQIGNLPPAPILLDIRMPDIDGMTALSRLADLAIHWPVIVITAHGDVPLAVECMKRGAIEFLEKPFSSQSIDSALGRAYRLLKDVETGATAAASARAGFASLTCRESQILLSLLGGAPNKNVAADLGLSIRTVEMHRANALSKLGVRTLVEAAGRARIAEWSGKNIVKEAR